MTERIPVIDPATGEELDSIPAGAEPQAEEAVGRARAAHSDWAAAGAAARAEALKHAARLLRDHLDELAVLQTRENGKPLDDSRGGVLAGIGAMEQYAELGPLHRGRSLHGEWMATDLMVRVPYGVAALVVPWNDPVAITAQLVAAALVTGNTVVLKPSERTPLTAIRMLELTAGCFPDGVWNLLLGDARAGEALVRNPDVDVVAHTGSVATGRAIAAACAPRLAKAILELGGKDPLVVDAGIDPTWAAEQAAIGAFANAGQICTSVERIYCHEAVAERFLDELTKRAERLRLGPGLEPDTEMGPLIDDRQRALVHAHVTEAVEGGARLLTGGAPLPGPGSFYPPTVLAEVDDDMAVMREETFGPVAPVRVVRSFDEGLAAADRTEYGLAATVLTADPAHAQRAWRELRVGTVKINAVFGGAPGGAASPHKASGSGLGYGPELLDELTRIRVVHHRTYER